MDARALLDEMRLFAAKKRINCDGMIEYYLKQGNNEEYMKWVMRRTEWDELRDFLDKKFVELMTELKKQEDDF